VLAALWTQSAGVHGSPLCSVWLGNPACSDQWFSLALFALGLACLAQYAGLSQKTIFANNFS
jgi:hypothetical protein